MTLCSRLNRLISSSSFIFIPSSLIFTLVENFDDLLDQLFLADVFVFAVAVSCTTASIVDVPIRAAILERFEFLFGSDARSAEAASEQFREGEFVGFADDLVALQLLLHFLKQFFGDDRLVLALIPRYRFSRILEHPVIERLRERAIDSREREVLVAPRMEVEVDASASCTPSARSIFRCATFSNICG